jgi:hypothetical protein
MAQTFDEHLAAYGRPAVIRSSTSTPPTSSGTP